MISLALLGLNLIDLAVPTPMHPEVDRTHQDLVLVGSSDLFRLSPCVGLVEIGQMVMMRLEHRNWQLWTRAKQFLALRDCTQTYMPHLRLPYVKRYAASQSQHSACIIQRLQIDWSFLLEHLFRSCDAVHIWRSAYIKCGSKLRSLRCILDLSSRCSIDR